MSSGRPRSSARQHEGAAAPLDWVAIEQQLNGIPADFKSAKFSSLKRVIEILSREKPQRALAELQQELATCDKVIDTIVDKHHLGFNHAIENYSKILSLFNECKSQAAALRANFDESRSCIGAVSGNLRPQWQTSMALQGSISILRDVQAAVAAHGELQRLVNDAEWRAAVPVLLRLANKLSIEELSRLGALSAIRASMRSHYDTVCAALVASVVTLTYQRPTALQAAATAADDTAAATATTAAAVRAPVSYHPRIAALLAERQDVALFAAGPEGADAGAEQEGDAEARAVVASLAQLDAIDALRRRVVAEAEGQVHRLLERTLTAAQAHGAGDGDRDAPTAQRRTFVPPAAAPRVAATALTALSALLLVLHNARKLFAAVGASGGALAAARRLDGRAIRGLLKGGGGDAGSDEEPEAALAAQMEAAAAGDLASVWGAMQQEVIGLLACLVRAPSATLSTAQASAAAPASAPAPGAGSWLGSLVGADTATHRNARAPRVGFRFETSAATGAHAGGDAAAPANGVAATAGVRGAGAGAAPSTRDYKDLVELMLRRAAAPSAFLVTLVYTPASQFARAGGAAAGGAAGRGALQAFLDAFVTDTLLPRALQDSKAACAAMLQHKQAFATSAAVRSTERSDTYVLQAAHGMESLLGELSHWAVAMPAYAAPLAAVAATVLTHTLERVDAALRALLQAQPHLAALLDRSSVVDALEAEPGLRFVEEDEVFADPWREVSPSASDAVLRAVMAAPAPAATDQAASIKVVAQLAALVNVLMHVVRAAATAGPHFAPAADDDAAARSDTARSAAVRSRAPSAAANSAAAAHRRVGSFAESVGGGDAAARVLPQLRGVLPGLPVATRAQAAAAAALSRTLAPTAAESPPSLQDLSHKMRLKAGRCLAAIRLHVIAMVAEVVDAVVARGRHAVASGGGRERDPALLGLLRSMHRVEGELRPYLSPQQLLYVLADAPRVAYRLIMWSVPRVSAINSAGIERLLQWLQLLKGSLAPVANLASASAAMRAYSTSASDAALDACQTFLRLLQGHVNNIVLEASRPDKRRRLSKLEWLSLLDVNVEGRTVSKQQRTYLRQSLESAEAQSGARSLQSAAPEQSAAAAETSVREKVATMLAVPFSGR